MCHSLILSWQNHGTAIGQTDSAATKYAMFTCTGVLTAIGFVVLSVLLLLVQSGGRKLQSIGTPYYGSPLAGLIAWLGSILGIGCGSNDDLTYRAAQQWVSKLPPEKQKEVFYYTTQVSGECCRRKVDAKLIKVTVCCCPLPLQYKYNNILDHFCLPGASAVLSQPNDGVAELDKTPLPYGNPVQHYIGECHTVLMHWPPQCKDHTRNQEINAAAAR